MKQYDLTTKALTACRSLKEESQIIYVGSVYGKTSIEEDDWRDYGPYKKFIYKVDEENDPKKDIDTEPEGAD